MSDSEQFKIDLTQWKTNWDRRTKIKRGVWEYFVRPIYRLVPGRRARLRVSLLRMMGAKIGTGCTIEPHVDVLIPWELEIGDHVAIGHHAHIQNFTKVTIGSMSVISQYAYLGTGTHDYTHPHFNLVFHPITIEPESWVAASAFIGPGVTLGRGCVIGAASVVMKDMPSWSVCAGNPCRVIKTRDIQPA